MIAINSPQKQDDITKLLTESDGDFKYEFVKKTGMKLEFKVTPDDSAAAAKEAKSLIKGQPWGPVLFFQVLAE